MNPLASLITPFAPNTEGIFQIDYDTYAQAPGVRQSTLADMAQSPAHCKWNAEHPRDCTAALNFGRLLHTAIFEPELYCNGISHWVKPEGMKFSTKEGKAWRDERCQGRFDENDILTAKEAADIKGMADSICSHDIAGPLTECEGLNEVSAFCWHDEGPDGSFSEEPLLRKCRPDRICVDSKGRIWVVDLKSCEDAREIACANSAASYGYHRQAAYYLDVLSDLGVNVEGFIHVFVEKKPPHGVNAFRIIDDHIDIGRQMYRAELAAFAKCQAMGNWPGYTSGIKPLELPYWAVRREEVAI